jgi:hypothetical protein
MRVGCRWNWPCRRLSHGPERRLMLDLPLNLSPSLKGPGTEQRVGGGSCGPARESNVRKRLSLQHMRLLLHRSATVHNNERPASPNGDAWTKVGTTPWIFGRRGRRLRPLVGHMTSPHDRAPLRAPDYPSGPHAPGYTPRARRPRLYTTTPAANPSCPVVASTHGATHLPNIQLTQWVPCGGVRV